MIRRLPGSVVLEKATRRVVAGNKLPSLVVADSIAATDSAELVGYRNGYAEGFEAGESDGRQEANRRMQIIEEDAARHRSELTFEQERFQRLIDGMEGAMARHQKVMEATAYELALMCLTRAFGHLQKDRQLLKRLCTQVAGEFHAKGIHLAVSAEDKAFLPDAIGGLRLIDEPALAQGTCRIVIGRGYAETSVEMRLAAIYDTIREALGISAP